MTLEEIKKLIQDGEKIDVEFKESRNALTRDIYDTVCSFNNRNVYKYTQLYSGKNPIFEEGDMFRTIIPLKKIATRKVGIENVSLNVPLNVPLNSREEIKNAIIELIKNDNKVTRKFMAESLKISEKTVSRYIKEMPDIRYVGTGKSGHWEFNKDSGENH